MIVRSPAEYYLKYLITHPDKFNNAAIKKECHSHRLLCLGDAYLDSLREGLHPPHPFLPSRLHHEPSAQFLIEEGFYGLWHRNPHTQLAVDLLEEPHGQEIVESMLSVGSPPNSIAALLNKRGVAFSTQAVARYKKYFWNVDLVNTAELRQICHYMAIRGQEGDDESMKKAAVAAARSNPRVLASELPSTPLSAALVQTKMGFVPASLDMYAGLKKNMQFCTLRIYECLAIGGRYASENAKNWAWTLQMLASIMESMTAPEEDLKKMMLGMELVTKPLATPTINELSDGDFSDGSFAEDPDKQKKKKRRG